MSLRLRFLNRYLRAVEKPLLERGDPEEIRRKFEIKATWLFPHPMGTTYEAGALGEVPVLWARAPGARRDRTLFYLHGGGYVYGSARSHRKMLARLSQLTGWQACLVDYRLAPEHPFPAQFEDAVAAFEALDTPAVIGGDSAGGGLALALHAAKQGALGCFALSPLTDLTFSGDSFDRNAARDVLLPVSRVAELTKMVMQGAPATDPRISPLYADFTGAAPVWMCCGDTEILLDDTRRMTGRLREQGVEATEVIAPDHPHVWPYFQGHIPEAMTTLKALAGWIRSLDAG